MKRFLSAIILFGVSLLPCAAIAMQSPTVQPFSYAHLTVAQADLWDRYLEDQASIFGCAYGDDPRLTSAPTDLLEDLAAGADIDPVKVTLRTFLRAGPAVKDLLSRNMTIASMACDTVYFHEGDLIGHPVIPFEEFLDLVLRDYNKPEDLKTVAWLIKHTKIAPLDPRIMWALFAFDEPYYADMGLSYQKLDHLLKQIDPEITTTSPRSAPAQLFMSSVNLGTGLEGRSCKDPSHDASPTAVSFIDKDLSRQDVKDINDIMKVWHQIMDFEVMVERPNGRDSRPWLSSLRFTSIKPGKCTQ